ncbi:MAG: hypothetical protein IT370_31475 [Deltaproteobacteria bacterium]|nr:hypothetical protein [Deltaproteobacteria bacterium]
MRARLPKLVLGLSLLTVLALTGCRSMSDLRPRPNQQWTMSSPPGSERLFRAPVWLVYDAAMRASQQVGLDLAEVDPARQYLLARRDMTTFSWGELVGVYFKAVGDCACYTLVRVESRRVLATNVTAKDFTLPVLEALATQLGGAPALAAAMR